MSDDDCIWLTSKGQLTSISVAPAILPAKNALGAVSTPLSSANSLLYCSFVLNFTALFGASATIGLAIPRYNAAGPSVARMERTRESIEAGGGREEAEAAGNGRDEAAEAEAEAVAEAAEGRAEAAAGVAEASEDASCILVFNTSVGYMTKISNTPAPPPAMSCL